MVLSMLLITFLLGMVAFAVDIGYIVLVRTQLQVAADSAAMSAAASMGRPFGDVFAIADQYAGYHAAGSKPVELDPDDVELGLWDTETRTFTPTPSAGNAVRVVARRDAKAGGEVPLFFARVLGTSSFDMTASAVAMANPRDIAFVVDLSGSMNNDTEPCWATDAINDTFASEGYPTVGDELMQQVYDDFGFGAYPGVLEHLGQPWGIPQDRYAYAELTKNDGVLDDPFIPENYRIEPNQNERLRKKKAYSAIIDYQIAQVMPNAKPFPNSANNYKYWEKYLDYIIEPVRIRYSGPGRPPNNRGWLPPNQDSDRIDRFGNPSSASFPNVSRSVPRGFRNKIGYRTYVQFMMDYGREIKPDGRRYVALSQYSPDCPWHSEVTAGGVFSFPPREQPTHAARRSIIAALQVVKERNAGITNPNQRDWVSIITFDRLSDGGPTIEQPLTADYDQAMQVCTRLQAVGDIGASTASEAGIIAARQHIRPRDEGGQGRMSTNKVVVLLTDGLPNLYISSRSKINSFVSANPSPDFYGGRSYAYDATLMQAMQLEQKNWYLFPVGIGLGANYDFMDRLARLGGTASNDGQSPRGSGNPAEYEQRLTDIFEEIITNPQVRLVQ